MKPALALLVLACVSVGARGGNTGDLKRYQDAIYKAYVEDHMPLWESTIREMEEDYAAQPADSLLYDILLAQYGLIGYYLGNESKSKGEAMLESAEAYLDQFEETPGFEVQAKLFRAAFHAFRINLRPWRSVQLGIASERLINRALALDAEYPRGHLEKGNMLFYAPAIFGGSKRRSVEHYENAVALFRKHLPNNHRWLYLSTLVALATAYEETDQAEAAMQTLEEALEYEPGFVWVRDELLPELKSRLQ